jgi:hypothetical protein
MTDRINIQTVEGRQKLIAKLEDINAGLHQLDLHVMHLDRETQLCSGWWSRLNYDGPGGKKLRMPLTEPGADKPADGELTFCVFYPLETAELGAV